MSEAEGFERGAAGSRRRGLIVDWGGVLTTPLYDAISEWLRAERIDIEHYRAVMGEWFGGAYAAAGDTNPIHGLEVGTLDPAEFERLLAARLHTVDGGTVTAAGLLTRMFAAFRPVEPMYAVLRQARAAGIRTCLLSNSWGNTYPRDAFAELFDAVVISAEVGMRKPGEEIFRYALDQLSLSPSAAVFVDDIAHNVAAAEALGIAGVHHREVPETVKRLEELLAVALR